MNPIATDEEKVMLLKAWWQRNYRWLLIAAVVLVTAFFGYKYYSQNKIENAQRASTLFTEFFGAYEAGQTDVALPLAQQLQDEYADTAYANAATLLLAQGAVTNNDLVLSAELLETVIEKGPKFAQDIARARLAQVKLAQNDPESTLKLLDQVSSQGYQPAYDEIKGDAFVALQRFDDARKAYEMALAEYTALGLETHLLKFKIDALGASNQ